MNHAEIAKLILLIYVVISTIGSILLYNLKVIKNFEIESYVLSIISILGALVSLSLDNNLFKAECHQSTYYLTLIILVSVQIIAIMTILLIKHFKNKKTNEN